MKKLVVITFMSWEGILPIQLSEQYVIVTTLQTKEEIESLAQAIANVKHLADDGESISDFPIPEHWNDLAWNVKLSIVVDYMQKYTGVYEVLHLYNEKVEILV